eukprot:13929065-Heterocapsa_arctica.AAC.1
MSTFARSHFSVKLIEPATFSSNPANISCSFINMLIPSAICMDHIGLVCVLPEESNFHDELYDVPFFVMLVACMCSISLIQLNSIIVVFQVLEHD